MEETTKRFKDKQVKSFENKKNKLIVKYIIS